MNHIDNLKASILSEGAYAGALHDLKASKPSKAELAAICEDVTGFSVAASATMKDIYSRLEIHGAAERRGEARAKVSRERMPI